MEKQDQILNEIKELKSALTQVLGLASPSTKDLFSTEALEKAAKEYRKLSIERGEWVSSHDIKMYVKSASYNPANFIIKELEFSNYFKRGSTYYFKKQDLIALAKELKDRNVDLGRYEELKADQEKFKKYLENAKQNKKGKKAFKITIDTKNITSDPVKLPPVEELKAELKKLREEFLQYKLAEYVDVYKDSYAMIKYLYHVQKYIEPGVQKRIRKWIIDFNNVNHLLTESKVKKEKFIPIKDEDVIQL
jgi:hypothetical protein